MSLSDLSNVSSLVSGLAVIITLIFLLLQMRQTNRNQQSLMQQGRTARWVTILLNRATPEMTRLNGRLWEGDLSLNGAEIHASIAQDAATLWSIEDSFLQHKAGTLDELSWTTELAILQDNLTIPRFRVSWKMALRDIASAEYRAFVDSLMAQTRPHKPGSLVNDWKLQMDRELMDAA